MKFNHVRSILLGTTILSPGLLLAQYDPTAPAATQTQSPIQPQTQPGRPPQQVPPSQQDSGPNAGDVGQIMQEKMFLRKAAEGGIAEVKLGQLAVQKGSSDEVKAFGQKMVDDHSKLNAEIAQLADSMGVMLPKSMNKEDQAEYNKLNALSGSDFDIEYLSFMVKDHHQDLHAFRMEAASPTEATLHNQVVKAQGIIHEHTVMVDKLARAKGIAVPTHGHKPNPAPTL
jgi:putative membrane protein